MLTNAVQMAPPAFVFSSSCWSAASAEELPVSYEDQTFDLPGAFLQAGVEAYVGTLWAVDELAARQLTEKFYEEFLRGEHSLGECLRLAKWDLKQQEEREKKLNWLAFILYGDPTVKPARLFPALLLK
jgi:CHAT domain-containing protein